MYVSDGKYHRHLLGGGNVLKAVTRTKRAAAGGSLGHPTGALRAQRRALLKLQAVAGQLDTTIRTDLVTPQGAVGARDTEEAGATKEAA